MTVFKQKDMNHLWDIYGWYWIPNNGNTVVTENDALTRVSILAGQTDFIAPFMIWAVENGDGDFTDPTIRKYTGGWHGYNNNTDGNYSATARVKSIKVYCDGAEVTQGHSAVGFSAKIVFTNAIQASNTEKENGTGREVLDATYSITFSEKIKIGCTLKALEEININRMYGLSFYRKSTTDKCRAIGSRNHREEFTLADDINFDTYTSGIIEHSANGDIIMGIDKILDLGSGYASERSMGATVGGGKAYMSMIFDNELSATSGFNMAEGDEARWAGYYQIEP